MKDSKKESKGILVDEISKIANINFRFHRISSMLLDHAIMSIVIVPPMVLIMFLLTEKGMLIDNEVLLASVVFFPLMFVYLNKDFFNGKSPAKRILGYQVVDKATEKPATELKCSLGI